MYCNKKNQTIKKGKPKLKLKLKNKPKKEDFNDTKFGGTKKEKNYKIRGIFQK